jgi:uncharacterized membrane protein YbhN (UPF0104 family)
MLFASGREDQRSRRPTDIAVALANLLLLILAAVVAKVAADLDRALYDAITALPDVLNGVWRAVIWGALGWGAAVALAAVVQRRIELVRDMALGVVTSIVVAVTIGAILTDDAWAAVSRVADLDGPPAVPPGTLTFTAAAIAVANPYLARPFRHLGWWLVAGQFVAVLVLGAALPTGALMAIAIGVLAAALVHLAMGSPGGRPTIGRIAIALRDLGLDVDDLTPTEMQAAGVVRYAARDANGPLDIKIYGRDAWDAQLLATLWRLVWYRGTQRTARLSRLELVEHEGFISLLAERAGVRASRLVTAGNAGQGDALVVVRRDGVPLSELRPDVDDEAVDGLWRDLARLHKAGVAHSRIDLDRIVARTDGTLGFGDLSSGAVMVDTATSENTFRATDQAQLFALCILLVGEDRAVAAARRAIGDDGVIALVPSLQEAALPPGVRDEVHRSDLELEDVRKRMTAALGVKEQPLTKLRRVTVGSVINLALLVFAAFALVSVFGNMDMESFVDALRDASWWWLLFALMLAQIPRIPAAVSTMGSISRPLPLGPLTALQFAICYVNLAIPSTAARVAVNVRFLERFGLRPTEAMTAGVIDSVSGFVVQIVLFLLLFFTSDLDLGLSTDGSDLSGAATFALIVLVALVVAAVIVVSVAPVRRRVLAVAREAKDSLGVLRTPRKLAQLFGGNLLSQVLFAVAFGACARAFDADVALGELLLINTVVSLFAGLLPIPGGVGVSEAGLTWGLTAAGLPSETAFAVALAYRMTSFYLPPVWGWFCYRWLIERRYL